MEYMEKLYGDRATAGDKSILYSLRAEAERLEAKYEETKAKKDE